MKRFQRVLHTIIFIRTVLQFEFSKVQVNQYKMIKIFVITATIRNVDKLTKNVITIRRVCLL